MTEDEKKSYRDHVEEELKQEFGRGIAEKASIIHWGKELLNPYLPMREGEEWDETIGIKLAIIEKETE